MPFAVARSAGESKERWRFFLLSRKWRPDLTAACDGALSGRLTAHDDCCTTATSAECCGTSRLRADSSDEPNIRVRFRIRPKCWTSPILQPDIFLTYKILTVRAEMWFAANYLSVLIDIQESNTRIKLLTLAHCNLYANYTQHHAHGQQAEQWSNRCGRI